jgi:hypothetical protein
MDATTIHPLVMLISSLTVVFVVDDVISYLIYLASKDRQV